MVHIIPNSAALCVVQPPLVEPPVVEIGGKFPVAFFRTKQRIIMVGEVGFGREGGDSTDGWMVGFIQAGWCMEDWAYYRGERNADGSVLVRRDAPPALLSRACRDCLGPVSDVFVEILEAQRPLESLSERPGVVRRTGPTIGTTFFWDEPKSAYHAWVGNYETLKINYLREVAREMQFCTVLSVRDPNNNFHHQKHVYWSLRWHATFQPKRFSESCADYDVELDPKRGQQSRLSVVLNGAPDPILSAEGDDVLTSQRLTQSCNQMHRAAEPIAEHKDNRRNSATWEMPLPNRRGSVPPHFPLGWWKNPRP